MANGYSQKFTLRDIFCNPKLAGKLPIIKYKEIEKDEKTYVRTSVSSIPMFVYSVSRGTARPFYKNMTAIKLGDAIAINGDSDFELDEIVDAVYNGLNSQKYIMSMTANNISMIRDALKESEKERRTNGQTPKLYLRVGSMEEIEGMSRQQIEALMQNVMENLYYNEDFGKTQKKYSASILPVNSALTYKQRQLRWKFRVGDI